MKKLIGILTLGIVAIFATPSADARPYRPTRTYVEFHRSCGGPAWIERYVACYDSCGRPVFRTRVVPVVRYRRAPVPYCGPVIRPGISVHIGGGCR